MRYSIFITLRKAYFILGNKNKIRDRGKQKTNKQKIFLKSLEPSCEDTDLSQSLQQLLPVWRTSEMSGKPRTMYHGSFLFWHASEGLAPNFHLTNIYVVPPACQNLYSGQQI